MSIAAFLILSVSAPASGAELQRLRSGAPTSRPVISAITTADPVDPRSVQVVLKEGAPTNVRKWFDDLPHLRQRRVADFEKLIADERGRLAALEAAVGRHATPDDRDEVESIEFRIEEEQANLDRLWGTKLKKIDGGRNAGDETDAGAAARLRLAVAASKKKIGELRKRLKDREKSSQQLLKARQQSAMRLIAEYERRIDLLENDPLYIDMPQLVPVALGVDKYGYLDSTLKVVQVVDESNVIVEVEELNVDVGAVRTTVIQRDRLVWLSGFDTSTVVDDDILHAPMPIVFDGVKDCNVRGRQRKILKAEPLNVLDWLEVKALKSLPEIPSIRLGGGIA
ncbi:MAG: hypothetical protein WBD40_20955 [Tepidisphaeraceae bacterium]